MAGFYVPLVRSPSIWTTPHVEFSTTMTFENLIMGLNDQFSLYDSINTGAFEVLGDLSLLTTTADSDIVSAVNELDSDLWGPGGGSVADLNAIYPSVGAAINELIFLTGAGGNTNLLYRDSSYNVIINGDQSDLDFTVGKDINLRAANNINLEAGNDILFRSGGADKIVFDVSSIGGTEVTASGDLNVIATDDVGIYPNNKLKLGGNDTNPNIELTFGSNNILDMSGSLDMNVEGSIDIQSGGNQLYLRDFDDNIRLEVNMADSDTKMNFVSDGHISAQGDVIIQGNNTIFYDQNGIQFGAVAPLSGHLQIKTGDTPAINFNNSSASFTGGIKMPTSGSHAVPIKFQNELGSSVNAVDQLLDALNNKIPLVYDRNGVVLNRLVLS